MPEAGGRGGGGGGLAFPVPGISFPGFTGVGGPFPSRSQIGFGVNFPQVFGVGTEGIEIAGSLVAPFSGPSAADITKESIARLEATGNPALRNLGAEFTRLNQAGIPLSTSNPQQRQLLGTDVHNAVLALEAQGFPRVQAYNAISDIVSRGTTEVPAPRPIPPTPPSSSMMSFGSSLQDFVAPFARTQLPRIGEDIGAAAGEAAALAFLESPLEIPAQLTLPATGAHLGRQAGEAVANYLFPETQPPGALEPLKDCPECGYYANQPLPSPAPVVSSPQPVFTPPPAFPGGQPIFTGPGPQAGQPLTLPGPQGGDVPTQIQLLRDQLGQEIQTEGQQGAQQTLQQIQQQVQQLKMLESQPVSSRNVQQELQRKQQLLDQLNQLDQQYPTTQSYPTLQTTQQPVSGPQEPLNYTPPAYHLEPNGQPQPQQPTPQQPQQGTQQPQHLQPQQQQPQPGVSPGGQVRFCVECTDQSESLKFLNGEPSECNIVTE